MRTFYLSSTSSKVHKNFLISSGSFIISVILPIIVGLDEFLIICIMVTLLIHELGHFFAMKYFKYKNLKIIFCFIVAITTTTTSIESRFHKIIVSLAGPLPGIIIGSIILIFKESLPDQLDYFAECMVFINAFNLIPVAVLDGGNIFESLFIPNSNKKIGIFNLITGTGSILICTLCNQYILVILFLYILVRGIIFLQHRKYPPLIKFIDRLKINQIIILTVIWLGALFVAIFVTY